MPGGELVGLGLELGPGLGRGMAAMLALGIRHTSVRPARSVLSLALIAFASFVLVSVGAFKKDVTAGSNDPRSGTGGFSLMAARALVI